MNIKKVDIDQQDYPYSSYVVAGDFIFTSIRSGSGKTLREQANDSIKDLEKMLSHENITLDNVVKVTVTFKKGENFEDIKDVFKEHFKNGFPARNTIVVDQFLGDSILFQIDAIAYNPNKS